MKPIAQRQRVLLLIPHLGGGGAERVTALLARYLSGEKYDLHLGLITQNSGSAPPLPPDVTVHGLSAPRVRRGALRLLLLIRRLQPDLILSGMAHLNFLVLLLRPLFGRRARLLVRQNTTVSAALADGRFPLFRRLLYRHLYRRADWVICQSQAMAEDLVSQLRFDETRVAVLPNPIDAPRIRASAVLPSASSRPSGRHLLAVGRLSREKGFDLLLRALGAVHQEFSDLRLTIAGSGAEEEPLKALARELGLSRAVRFAGYLEDPAALYSSATLFVLSSRYEGMPNAMLEAAAGGLPIVAFPASGGVVQLLRGQPGVWIVPRTTAGALATSLREALAALRPGERFNHEFVEQFTVDRAIPAYEELIDTALGEITR